MNVLQNPGVRIGLLCLSSLSLMLVSQPGSRFAAARPVDSVPSEAEWSSKSSSDAFVIQSDAPVQISEGEGGAFNYQIWQNLSREEYYLFIWEHNQADGDEPAASYNFDSAAGAVNFFTCRYAREQLTSCNMLVSSVSYDVPETCVFPWANCESDIVE